MSSTVIRDFLVSLGFTTDNEGARKMGDALESVTKKSVVLKTALLALATGTVAAVAKTASELDKLYYSSQRIGASAENIRAYGDAVSQMGGDAQSALQSLESVAQKMRNSPGYEGMLQGLGVATRDSNGAMRDRVDVMKDLSKTFKDMPTHQANAYASSLGIDEKTMLAMRDGKFVDNMEKYQKIRSQVGLNDELAESGSQLMTEFNDTAIMTKAITEVVVMTAGKALLPILKLINKTLMSAIEWFDSLNPSIKTFLAAGLKIATVAVVFGGLIGVLSKIGTVLPLLKGLLFLIKGLNLAFLASPIGIVLALASAIALLWDDYQTWKNGGESLIDWSKWSAGIETAIEKIGKLVEWIGNLKDKVIDITVDMWEKAKNKIFNETTEQVVAEAKEKTKEVAGVISEQVKVAAGVAAQALKTTASVATGGLVGGDKPFKTAMTSFKGGIINGFTPEETLAFANRVMQRENKSGKTNVVNKWGYTGKYQFGASALADTGFIDRKKFDKASKGVKNGSNAKAHRAFLADKSNWLVGDWEQYKSSHEMQDLSFKRLVENNLKSNKNIHGNDVKKMMGFAMAAHLKGAGNAKKWYSKGLDSKDGNGTKTSDYAKFGENTPINNIGKSSVESNFSSAMKNSHFSNKTTNATLLPASYSASNNAKTVTIHQSYKAEMLINGAENPQMTASAIKRESENAMIRMAHNAKGVMG